MKLITYHLTGNANVKAAVYGFAKAQLLSEFHVSIAAFPGGLLNKISSLKPFAEIRRRRFDSILRPYIHTWPWYDYGRLLASKMKLHSLSNESGPFFIDKLCQNQDKRIAARLEKLSGKGVRAIYGYEDCVALSFHKAKSLGLKCLYDLPIGYWRKAHSLLEKEKEKWPEFANTLIGLKDSLTKLARKDEELALADRIFVASNFTANTLKEYPGRLAPVEVIPYGFPLVNNTPKLYNVKKNRPLKLLFVGSLSQRKGIAYLFSAVETLKQHVQLTIVGNKTTNNCPALDAALTKHKWFPSLSHEAILKLMRENDVLVFPSLFEGFGLVISEAMSQGTPVITTDRTAGPDLITNSENGWLIEAGSTEALQNAIIEILMNPTLIEEAGKNALETARKRTWETYSRELAVAVKRCLV
jgi:glycosyltransferase involved in cell wall biosynthesis